MAPAGTSRKQEKMRPPAGAGPAHAAAMNSTQIVKDLIAEGITLGPATSAGPLTLFALTHRLPAGDHLLYQDAQARGQVSVEETSESGTVGELRVTNRGPQPVLLLEGEVLLGMKQTRVLNASILVAAMSVLNVPVSCVEAGRWRHTSQSATGKDTINLSPRVRMAKTASVLRSSRAMGTFASDQSAVWAGVADVLSEHGVSAPTHSYAEIARERGSDIRNLVEDLHPVDGQSGVLAFIAGRPSCLDLFDGPAALANLWEALVASYAADAEAGGPAPTKAPTSTKARRWLEGLAGADIVSTPSVGLGDHVTLVSASAEAAGLVYDGRLLHLAAFPVNGSRTRTSFMSPERRRA